MAVSKNTSNQMGVTPYFVPEEETGFYFVSPEGHVVMKRYEPNAENLALVFMRNCFPTPEEADTNIKRVLKQYEAIK